MNKVLRMWSQLHHLGRSLASQPGQERRPEASKSQLPCADASGEVLSTRSAFAPGPLSVQGGTWFSSRGSRGQGPGRTGRKKTVPQRSQMITVSWSKIFLKQVLGISGTPLHNHFACENSFQQSLATFETIHNFVAVKNVHVDCPPSEKQLALIATTVDGQNIQTLQHALCWTPAPPNLNVSARVLAKVMLGVWFVSSIGANALQVTITLNFGGEGVVPDRRGLDISSIYGSTIMKPRVRVLGPGHTVYFGWSRHVRGMFLTCRKMSVCLLA